MNKYSVINISITKIHLFASFHISRKWPNPSPNFPTLYKGFATVVYTILLVFASMDNTVRPLLCSLTHTYNHKSTKSLSVTLQM